MQCDFNLPERFDLEYASEDNTRKRPIMVHRAIFGSIERFFGVLLESTAGDFPLWLNPTQVRLLPVTDNVRRASFSKHKRGWGRRGALMLVCMSAGPQAMEYAKTIREQLFCQGIRAEVDSGNDRLAKQIRNAEQQRVPVMCIIGAKVSQAFIDKDHP